MYSNQKKGRFAGILFLILVITGVFAEFFVRQKLFVPNDPTATAQNIIDNQRLFRIGFVSDLLMSSVFFFYAFVLYIIFKPVSKNISLFMLLCVVISVAMYCQNMLNQYTALILLTDSDYQGVFTNDQLQTMSSLFFNMHGEGYFINQIFYGMYLFPLGYLIYKSGLVPKVIGVLLILGCIVDLINFVGYTIFPNSESIILQNITIPADVAEISFCLWLIIKGVKNHPSN